MARYFTLTDSENIKSKRFVVVLGGYLPTETKAHTLQRDLSGNLDHHVGGIYGHHEYTVKVSAEETDIDMGTLDDLRYFFRLNNPKGTPTDVLTMTDHLGNQCDVIMVKDFTPEPLTTLLEGVNAHFFVRVAFEFVDPIVGTESSGS